MNIHAYTKQVPDQTRTPSLQCEILTTNKTNEVVTRLAG